MKREKGRDRRRYKSTKEKGGGGTLSKAYSTTYVKEKSCKCLFVNHNVIDYHKLNAIHK